MTNTQSPSFYNIIETNTPFIMNQVDFDQLSKRLTDIKTASIVAPLYDSIKNIYNDAASLKQYVQVLEMAKGDPIWSTVLSVLKTIIKTVDSANRKNKSLANKQVAVQRTSYPITGVLGYDPMNCTIMPQGVLPNNRYAASNVPSYTEATPAKHNIRKTSTSSNGSKKDQIVKSPDLFQTDFDDDETPVI